MDDASHKPPRLDGEPILSLILCSRNDSYMGNSRWRLQTTLNYVAKQAAAIGRLDEIEVLVTDWGSEQPLQDVINLTPEAARIVAFLHVPPGLARSLQKDSPFPEVLALNAAARRARGQFIGRIDQDTLVGERFLNVFFTLCDGKRQLETPVNSAIFFSNVRMVPYRLSVRCPPLQTVKSFIDLFGSHLKIEITPDKPFYIHSVGIWLLSKRIWHECRGYDENMLYMNIMEVDMIHRLMQKYKLINLGQLIDFSFFHLEHYHPWGPRKSSIHRKINRWAGMGQAYSPNPEAWGLAEFPLEVTHPGPQNSAHPDLSRRDSMPRFAFLMLVIGGETLADRIVRRIVALAGSLRQRAKLSDLG